MKTNAHPRAAGWLSLTLGATLALQSISLADEIPRGTLDVDRDLVRTGTRSNLDWKIEYPSAIDEIVSIDPPEEGTITPKQDVRMKVRVLGVAFQSGSTLWPVAAYWSLNKGSWESFFYGDENDVRSSNVLVNKEVKKNDTIDFGARGNNRYSWFPFYATTTGDRHAAVLKNGSRAPSYAPAFNQTSVANILKPYIDSAGRISIGERDLIVLFETFTSSPGSSYFDMQDIVILVTFE